MLSRSILIYINVSKTQLVNNIKDAGIFIQVIEKYLKDRNPQLSLDFIISLIDFSYLNPFKMYNGILQSP